MSIETKRQILLIDDDASLLRTLSDFLRFEGYDVIKADSGEKGLEKLTESNPNLIILDMSMPGMGGIGFLKEILDEDGKPSHPVLVLTARANMAEFFADVDVDGFVAKPCDPQDLLMEVGRIIFLRSGDELGERSTTNARKKILLGEDDIAIGKRLEKWLASHNFVVDLVTKGPDVLERAIVSNPNVILMNAVLEGMNGSAVAGMLKVMPNTKSIPVILYDNSGAKLPAVDVNISGGGIVAVVACDDAEVIQAALDKNLV